MGYVSTVSPDWFKDVSSWLTIPAERFAEEKAAAVGMPYILDSVLGRDSLYNSELVLSNISLLFIVDPLDAFLIITSLYSIALALEGIQIDMTRIISMTIVICKRCFFFDTHNNPTHLTLLYIIYSIKEIF